MWKPVLRLAQNLVGGAHSVLALGQGVGRGLALGLGLLQHVHQRAALVRQNLRQRRKLGNGLAGFLGARRQCCDLLGGAFGALVPLLRFGIDGLERSARAFASRSSPSCLARASA